MKKYKFTYKKGYNYYIVICKNIDNALNIIENYLKSKYPNATHYVNINNFNIEELPFTFVELQNIILETASKEHIESSYHIEMCRRQYNVATYKGF